MTDDFEAGLDLGPVLEKAVNNAMIEVVHVGGLGRAEIEWPVWGQSNHFLNMTNHVVSVAYVRAFIDPEYNG
jgi:hypothetical protein